MMYARYIQPRPVPKAVMWKKEVIKFPYNEWKLIKEIKFYKFLQQCAGTFEVTEFDTSPFEGIKDEIEFTKRDNEHIIFTTSRKAIQVLDQLPFIKKSGIRNKTVHFYRIINQWNFAYTEMVRRQVSDRPLKIGLYRTKGGWGDVQMVLQIFSNLKAAYPDSDLTFACPDYLLELCGRKGKYNKWRSTFPHVDKLLGLGDFRKYEFDIVADLTSPCLRYEVRHKNNIDKNRIQIFADQCRIGNVNDIGGEIGVEVDEIKWAKTFLKKHKLTNDYIVGIIPRSYDSYRSWNSFDAVAGGLEKKGFKCLIFDNSDNSNYRGDGIKVIGYSIRKVMALLRECHIVLGPDTGPMHTAAALGIPTVWLFGSIDGKIRTKGYRNTNIIQHTESCPINIAPCWYKKECKNPNPDCMKSITPEEVINKVLSFPKVASIVLTYELLNLTKIAINSIKKNTNVINKMLVVDNCSVDGTYEYCVDNGLDNIILWGRSSVATALNVGIKTVLKFNPDRIAIFNNDIQLSNTFIFDMVNMYNGLENCGFLAGVQVQKNEYDNRTKQILLKGKTEKINECMIAGEMSAYMVSPDTIKTVGYFDEGFYPRYIEDNDYFHRIALSGLEAWRSGKLPFKHHLGAVIKTIPEEGAKGQETFRANIVRYIKKWGDGFPGVKVLGEAKGISNGLMCLGGGSTPFNGNDDPYKFNKKSCAILQLGRIGDIIATMPLAYAAQQAGLKITWYVNERFKSLFELVNYVDEVKYTAIESDVWGDCFTNGYKKTKLEITNSTPKYEHVMIANINSERQREYEASIYPFNKFIYHGNGLPDISPFPKFLINQKLKNEISKYNLPKDYIIVALNGNSAKINVDVKNLLNQIKNDIGNLDIITIGHDKNYDNINNIIVPQNRLSTLAPIVQGAKLVICISTSIYWFAIGTKTPTIQLLPFGDSHRINKMSSKLMGYEKIAEDYYWQSNTASLTGLRDKIRKKLCQ